MMGKGCAGPTRLWSPHGAGHATTTLTHARVATHLRPHSVDRHLFALRKLFEQQNPGAPVPAIFADKGTSGLCTRSCVHVRTCRVPGHAATAD
jgi:hypothetical protein